MGQTTYQRADRQTPFFRCFLVFAVGLATVPGLLAAASPQGPLHAAAPGVLLSDPESAGPAEQVNLAASLPERLLALAAGEALPVADWPVAPGDRRDLLLVPQDIYAPGARIYAVEEGHLRELARSPLRYFSSRTSDGQGGVVVSVDPLTQETRSFARIADSLYEMRSQQAAPGTSIVSRVQAPPAEASADFPRGDIEDFLDHPAAPRALEQETILGGLGLTATTQEHSATIAIDTDNEFMLLKFANNTASAMQYIANLFAAMNLMYERDLSVRLLQGTTFLRVSTTIDRYSTTPPGDAYCQNSAYGSADCPKIREFTNYWTSGCGGTCAGVPRALVAMLSGKELPGGTSGIGWVDGLCSTSYGYSFSQVIPSAGDTSAWDAATVGHEIGHNFGSPHTHAYNPPVDECSSGEAGGYSGPPSCPAASTYNGVTATGTMMSYCHRLVGCSTSMVFHPTVVARLQSILATHVPETAGAAACILPLPQPASGFYASLPCRAIDTRRGLLGTGLLSAPLQPGERRTFDLSLGLCAVPRSAKGITANLTATNSGAPGNLTVYPGNLPSTGTPNLYFRPGQTRSNGAFLTLATNGAATITVENSSPGRVDVLLDVSGYFE